MGLFPFGVGSSLLLLIGKFIFFPLLLVVVDLVGYWVLSLCQNLLVAAYFKLHSSL